MKLLYALIYASTLASGLALAASAAGDVSHLAARQRPGIVPFCGLNPDPSQPYNDVPCAKGCSNNQDGKGYCWGEPEKGLGSPCVKCDYDASDKIACANSGRCVVGGE